MDIAGRTGEDCSKHGPSLFSPRLFDSPAHIFLLCYLCMDMSGSSSTPRRHHRLSYHLLYSDSLLLLLLFVRNLLHDSPLQYIHIFMTKLIVCLIDEMRDMANMEGRTEYLHDGEIIDHQSSIGRTRVRNHSLLTISLSRLSPIVVIWSELHHMYH